MNSLAYGWRIAISIWTIAIALMLCIYAGTVTVGERLRKNVLGQHLSKTEKNATSAFLTTQRVVLSVETTLATAEHLVANDGPQNATNLNALLASFVSSNLVVRDIALVNNSGGILAAGMRETRQHGLSKSSSNDPQFPAQVTTGTGMSISAPTLHYASGEEVLYFTRNVLTSGLAGGALWVAIVPIATLRATLGYGAFEPAVVSFEKSDGTLLVGPIAAKNSGKIIPITDPTVVDGHAKITHGRTNLEDVVLAYNQFPGQNFRVVVALPISELYRTWATVHRDLDVLAAILALGIAVLAGISHRYLHKRLASSRMLAKHLKSLHQALEVLPDGMVLTNQKGEIVWWSKSALTLMPHASSYLKKGVPLIDWGSVSTSRPVVPVEDVAVGNWFNDSDNKLHLVSPLLCLPDGRIVMVREHAISNRGTIVMLRDVTQTVLDLRNLSLNIQSIVNRHKETLERLRRQLLTPANAIAGVVSLLRHGVSERDISLLSETTRNLLAAVNGLGATDSFSKAFEVSTRAEDGDTSIDTASLRKSGPEMVATVRL